MPQGHTMTSRGLRYTLGSVHCAFQPSRPPRLYWILGDAGRGPGGPPACPNDGGGLGLQQGGLRKALGSLERDQEEGAEKG